MAHAASFDCHKAATPIEKTICANSELSELDSTMAKAYAKALRGEKEKAEFLRESQRDWLSSLSGACQQETVCLTEKYKDHIDYLAALARPESEGKNFTLASISKHYRFVVHLYEACDAGNPNDGESCKGPARLTITSKDDAQFKQVIYLDNIEISFNGNKEPIANSNKLYDYQGVINVGDFNFDGHEDFAVQVGNEGSYGGPNYSVYLNDGDKFSYNAPLSQLTLENLGFFNVDPARQEIVTFAKSGCCWHQTSRFHMANNAPVIFERTTEDMLEANVDDVYVYTERLIHGKWKLISSNGKGPQNECEPTLDKVLQDNNDKDTVQQFACKTLPDEQKTRVAAAVYATSKQQVGLDVFYVNRDSGKVLAQVTLDDAYATANDSEMPTVHFMHIDTARYQLASGTRAIGIRTGFESGDTLLTLFVRNGDQVTNVLDKLVVDGDKNKDEVVRTVSIGKDSSHGFADLIVHEMVRKNGSDTVASAHDTILHYDGKRYVIPEELTRHQW